MHTLFDHWFERAGVKYTNESCGDEIIQEHIMQCYHPGLVIFLVERELFQ